MNQLRKWMRVATPEERQELADRAGTTIGNLHQISGSYRSGGRPQIRSGLAIRIEQAARILQKENRDLPSLVRTDLSPECADCEYARKCLGNRAVESDFAILPAGDTDSEGGEP